MHGLLFFAGGPALQVEHGSDIEINGQLWRAQHEQTGLSLTATENSDNKQEQLHQRLADIDHEVKRRREEVLALAADQARLMQLCEQVGAMQCILSFPSMTS